LFSSSEWTRLENNFTAWAQAQPSIQAAFAVGSRCRVDPPPDEWSDLDLMLFVTGREEFCHQNTWLNELGEVWNAVFNYTVNGDPEWLVTFAGGYNIDFVLLDSGQLSGLVQANPMPEPFVRGYRLLIDKDGLAAQLSPAPKQPQQPPMPSQQDLTRNIGAFWHVAFYMAKQIRRRDLNMVQIRDHTLKEFLMTMMVWHALAVRGPQAPVWHMGRFMERWADPQAVRDLPTTFGLYEPESACRALDNSLVLFQRLAHETSECLGLAYPTQVEEHMSSLVRDLLQGP